MPLGRAENGQGSSDRQHVRGDALFQKNLDTVSQDNMVAMTFQQDADNGAGHNRFLK